MSKLRALFAALADLVAWGWPYAVVAILVSLWVASIFKPDWVSR